MTKGFWRGERYGVRSNGDLVVDNGAFHGNIGRHFGAPFPRPAYDSGFLPYSQGKSKTLFHDVGGDAKDYVIDLGCRDTAPIGSSGIHIRFLGTADLRAAGRWGAEWLNLTEEEIVVRRAPQDGVCNEIAVRIWVYK